MQKIGQISLDIIFGVLVALILFGVMMQIWNPIYDNLVAPAIVNHPYAAIMTLIFYIIPVLVLITILLIPVFALQRSRGYPGA